MASPADLPVVTFTRVGTITDAATPNEPWLEIGAVQFDRTGGIVAAFPRENAIRFFTRDGKHLRSIGRQGSGPGEFERLGSIGWLGDTLWAVDRNGGRIHLFGPSGKYLRTKPALATTHDGFGVYASSMLQGGWVAYNGSLYADAMAAGRPRVAPMTVWQPPAGRPKEYARIATGTLSLVLPGNGLMSSSAREAQRFNRDGIVRTAPDGRSLVVVDRDPKASGGVAQYTVSIVEPNGVRRTSRTFKAPAVSVRKEHLAEFVRSYVEGMRTGPRGKDHFPSDASAKDYLTANLPMPAMYPAVSGLLVGTDGAIWLRAQDLGEPSVTWTVLDARLEPRYRVTLPVEFTPKAGTRDELWGTMVDDDDVPYFVHYRRAGAG
ncbi:MAG: hypothetical protein V4617_01240 [Gemmatimonadota bacterium]